MAHRRAVALAQQRQGDFARPEAGDPDRPSNLAEPSADLFLDLARGYGDFELAFQPLGACLGYLHRGLLTLSFGPAAAPQVVAKPLVRAGGFEPPRFSSLDPKSSASASSATPALTGRAAPARRRRVLTYSLCGT